MEATSHYSLYLRSDEVSHLQLCDTEKDADDDGYISLHELFERLRPPLDETGLLRPSRSFLKHHVVPVSCVYVLLLGNVLALRSSMHLSQEHDDDMMVCKYGCTEDFERRLSELARCFATHTTDIRVCMFCCIDNAYVMNAETSMKKYLRPFRITSDISDELIILPVSLVSTIKTHLKNIHAMYSGKSKQLMMKVQQLEHDLEMERLRHREELLRKQLRIERLQHEIMMVKHDISNHLQS